MSDLLERLGYPGGTRALIINCDGLGFSFEANTAIYEALHSGAASSASLMLPAPWARQAAAAYRGEDLGVQLVLNAEYDLYRWGPLTHAPSLLDGEGGFPRTVGDVWEHADLDEVRREWRAQIERAVLWGIGVDHLDAHLAGVELKAEFFDAYLDLAEEFRLPVRLPGAAAEANLGYPLRELAAERGVVAPDRALPLASLGENPEEIAAALEALPAGVTELHLSPLPASPAFEAVCPDWRQREHELELLRGLRTGGATVVGYRALARLTRA